MSTYYHGLDPFFSSIRLEKNARHAKITLWNKSQNIGTITIDSADDPEFLRILFTRKELIHQTAGPNGTINTSGATDLPDSTQLLSEYGELTTKGAL